MRIMDLSLLGLLTIMGVGSVTFLLVNYWQWRLSSLPEEGETFLLYIGLVLSVANIGLLLYYLFSRP